MQNRWPRYGSRVNQLGSTGKSWKRLLVWAALGLPLLGTALGAWQMQRLRDRAPAEVARILGAALGAQATVRSVSLDFAHAGLAVHGIEVRSGSRTLLTAAELVGRPALGALLRGRLELHALSVPSATVRLQAEDLKRIARMSAGSLVASITVADLQLALELTPQGPIEVEHGELTLSSADDADTKIELRSARATWKTAAGDARAHADVTLQGHWSRAHDHAAPSSISGAGRLRLDALRVADRSLAEPVTLNWQFAHEQWVLETELKSGAGTLGIHAKLTPEALALRVRSHGVAIEEALELAGYAGPTLHGTLDGETELQGTLSPLALAGSCKLTARSLRVLAPSQPTTASPHDATRAPVQRSIALDIPQLTAAGDLHLDPASFRFDAVQIGLGRSRLRGNASATAFGKLDAELRSDDFDLADLGAVWNMAIAGHGPITLSAHIGQAAPAIQANLSLAAAAIGGKQLGQLTADLRLDPATGRLNVEHAEANSPERHVVADGSTLDFESTGVARAQAKLRVLRLPLRELYRALGAADDPVLARLQGSAAGSADFVYGGASSDRPGAKLRPTAAIAGAAPPSESAALDLALALQLTAIDLAGYAFDRGSLSARIAIPDRTRGLAAGTLALSQLTLRAAAGTLDLSGEIRRGTLDMKLGLRGLPLERAPWLRSRSRTLLTGVIDGRGTLSGEASNTRADLQLGLDELRLIGEPLGRVQLQAQLRTAGASSTGDAATCHESRGALASTAFRGASAWLFCGDGLDGHLHVDLALGNGVARPVRGTVTLAEFALGPFLRGLQSPAADAASHRSTLSAALELSGGGLADPEQLSGVLRVQKLTLGTGDARLESAAPFEIRARDGVLSLAAARLTGPIQHFTLTAAGRLGKDGRLMADGEIASSVFTRDSEPLVKAFGNVGLHLEWTPGAQPALRGRAELGELAIRGPAAVQLRRARGALVLTGERVRLEGVEAELGGGKVGVTGQFELDGLRVSNYDLAIVAERVALEPEPLIQVELDAKTRLAWAGASTLPDLSGSVVVRRLAYGRPLHLEALAAMNRSRSGPPARDRLNLDLTIEQREPLRVRNTLLDGELTIAGVDRKLHVVGTDQRLGVLGALAVTRGRILFQGDQFHFTRGDIELRDPARIAPRFDVRAVADQPKRQDTSVVLSAQGTRDAFVVAIQCDAGSVAVDAPPFTCNYAHDRMSCDDFDRLVAQWACPTKLGGRASTRTKTSTGTSAGAR
jgi:hypothetical protein